MEESIASLTVRPISDRKTYLLLLAVTIWHGILAVGVLVAILFIWTAWSQATWLKILLSLLLALFGATSALTAMFIRVRHPRGRVLSLILNYLGALFCLVYALHILGVFLAIDALAANFARGLPFLVGVLLGYLINAFGDRYQDYPARQQLFCNIGNFIMVSFFLAFLLAVGLVQGLLALIMKFNTLPPLLLLTGLILFALMLWAMGRNASARMMQANIADEEMLNGLLFLSPNLIGFLLFFAGPLLFSLYVSFTNFDATTGQRDWIGLQNYARLFNLSIKPLERPDQPVTEALDVKVYDELARFKIFGTSYIIGAQDKLFWLALRNTFAFCILVLPLSIIPALLLANLLNSKIPGVKFLRAVYFLPSIAAVVGVALIWQWLYNAAVGYINYAISSLINAINSLPGINIADPQIRWLSDTRTALLAVVIMSAWQWIGFNTVLFLAGLQNIPKELYEAATVDGAGRWAKFWHVTIPLLSPTTFFVVTTTVINALQIFEQVYVLIPTEPPGGPNNSTLSLVLYLYQRGFQRFEQGYASSVAWVLFIVIFVVTLLQYWRNRASSYTD